VKMGYSFVITCLSVVATRGGWWSTTVVVATGPTTVVLAIPLAWTPVVVAIYACNTTFSFRITATCSQLVASFFVGQKNPHSSKVVWLEEKMMKGENGWLLQQQEQRYTLLSHCYYLLPARC
jgi:hypothetical protein